MNRIFLGAILSLVFCAPALAATSVDLDRDWLFRTDPSQIGATAGWQKRLPTETESVNLPHTWNLGRHDNYLGKAWYFRTFEMPGAGREPSREPAFWSHVLFGAGLAEWNRGGKTRRRLYRLLFGYHSLPPHDKLSGG